MVTHFLDSMTGSIEEEQLECKGRGMELMLDEKSSSLHDSLYVQQRIDTS